MDVIIIGGGASGISCAIRLKQNNPSCNVTVLEHLDEICKKIYATGNGRCNITNINADNYELTKSFFSSIGLVMRQGGDGRMYPYSNQASTVVEILRNACDEYGVSIVTACDINRVEKIGDIYNVYSNKGVFSSEVLILATGGKSQSALGSDGSGYGYAKEFGHCITELSPALVQLKSSSKHCRALKGLRTKCNVKLEINGEARCEEFGELLFAEYGISGIVVMDLSKHISDVKLKSGEEKCIAVLDLVPDMSEEELLEHYNRFNNYIGILPQRLCAILSKQANGNDELIAKYAKSWRIIITGTKGYDFAQITKGGVSLDELNDNNESKLCDNLYIIGELTDNQFNCGGFNLDYAFSSGVKAADDIASKNYD